MMHLPDFLHERDGEVRLAGHRVALFDLLRFYNEGYSAEMLGEQFPTLPLALIHKTLGFYWEHKAEIDAWSIAVTRRLDDRRAAGTPLDLAALRARLAGRRGAAAPILPAG